jgi:hypothetical protein
MKRIITSLFVIALTVPAVAKTHEDPYNMPCDKLWPVVKATLRTDRYKIIAIDSAEYNASYGVGNWAATTINTVLLSPKGNGCSMSVNSTFRGLAHNDAKDFKRRVDEALGIIKPRVEYTWEGEPKKAKPQVPAM